MSSFLKKSKQETIYPEHPDVERHNLVVRIKAGRQNEKDWKSYMDARGGIYKLNFHRVSSIVMDKRICIIYNKLVSGYLRENGDCIIIGIIVLMDIIVKYASCDTGYYQVARIYNSRILNAIGFTGFIKEAFVGPEWNHNKM